MNKVKELNPIKETTEDYEAVEAAIKKLFLKEIYLPLISILGESRQTLENAKNSLSDAIRSGRITFYRGQFTGKLSASISKELKALGAKWDRKTGSFKIPQSALPSEVVSAISVSERRFQQKISEMDKRLEKMLPEEIAEKLKVKDHFDTALFKVDKNFQKTISDITIAPTLTKEQRAKIAGEWSNNMDLWIKDFSQKQIKDLRSNLEKSVFAGNRVETAKKIIKDSYNVSENKAKFLARQETSLLMTKFKETRYVDAGINYYKWGCVAGSANHPVRPAHKALEGKVFRWDDPPVTTGPGEAVRKNNPGQDYNCRCFARPLVNYKPKE